MDKQEGDVCGYEGCDGLLYLPKVVGCSCYINPPCSACVDNRLKCRKCGMEVEDDVKDSSESKQYKQDEWKERDLDNTKIDFHSRPHTHFSMVKEGVCPKDAAREEVRKKVVGTFGGRFEYFGDGRFKYIAYTD